MFNCIYFKFVLDYDIKFFLFVFGNKLNLVKIWMERYRLMFVNDVMRNFVIDWWNDI